MEVKQFSSIFENGVTTYCPGCEHGLLLKFIGMALDELGITEKAIMVGSVGCSTLAYKFLNVDYVQAPHGRAPAVMSAIKLLEKDKVVFAIQGDGDALSIGIAELMHAANRGIPLTIFMYNNMVFGMTGGQMAPTTPEGMKTTTTPFGRDVKQMGPPIDACKVLSAFPQISYLKRVVITPKPIYTKDRVMYSSKEAMDSYKAVLNAFKTQLMGGFSFVEFIGTCNVNWKMTILDSKKYVHDVGVKVYPPGLCRDVYGVDKK
ncbi:MAG: thiamine pyrophosphate-dependent enzyme [Nitrososphaeria archaeon]|nr:thiamine pyrophosphate-dependent enzyme [Conexivisphaerales archaeon]